MTAGRILTGLVLFVPLIIAIAPRIGLADNGAVALARPVNKITVDGDFADWPSSLPWYPIEWQTAGSMSRDAADFDASFRVGYDKNALYVAVQVQDDSLVVEGTANWKSRDGCSVFLDVGHTGEKTLPTRYTNFADHSPRSGSGLAVGWSYQRSDTRHCYEWRFDLHRIHHPRVKLIPGLVVPGCHDSRQGRGRKSRFQFLLGWILREVGIFREAGRHLARRVRGSSGYSPGTFSGATPNLVMLLTSAWR
jgi:hypothetical protein